MANPSEPKIDKNSKKNVKLHAKWKDFDNSFASDTL